MYRNHRAIPSQAPHKLCIRVGNILLLTLILIVAYRYIFRRPVSKAVVPKVLHFPNISFEQDYERMERELKVYVYRDRDPGIYFLRQPRKVTGIYGSEAYFFKNIRESSFITIDPLQAHLFFIPISWHQMRSLGTPYHKMTFTIENYVQSLISMYPYWNRTQGADHFFVICHHIGVEVIEGVPLLKKNSIRLVCPVSYDTHYIPYKDISFPQVNQSTFSHPASRNNMLNRTKTDPWADIPNSKIRARMEYLWREEDTELDSKRVWNDTAEGYLLLYDKLFGTKFCICPHGFPVNTALIADSIRYECVPVIYTNYTDFPFNGILDWNNFSIKLNEDDLIFVKDILQGIREAQFTRLQNNLHKAEKHFQWNSPPISYDAFHMIMYELWLRVIF
ncbi:probable glycosyltransferase At5g03795 [Corylus avellana]|uniref:probable glycosyltransferase At5g03795 n=1 Tax=Corylus avellana TaxID=13451 RepID=UPI00286A55E2|nr:probable glycosyltransferase At5g03795 [Corylus avellana]